VRVKVGGKIYERSVPDHLFNEVKEKVKSVCRFDPSAKTWIFDPRKALCSNWDVLVEFFHVPDEEIRRELEEFKAEVDVKLGEMMDKGYFAFLPCGEVRRPFRMEGGLALLDLREVERIISREGPLKAYDIVLGSINGYYLEEHLKKLESLFSSKRVVILRDAGRKMVIEIPYPEEGIISSLELASKVKYYVRTLKDVQVKELTVLKRKSYTTFEGPFFMHHRVQDIAKRYNYSVSDEVNWPDQDVALYKDFSLYDFQKRAVDSWERNGRFGTVVMPTGAGKTYVGLEAIFRTSKSTLICVVTEELAKQWFELISEKLSFKPGIFTGRKKEVRPITVGIYNSVAKHIEGIFDKFSLIIFDEVHHVPAATFKEIAFKAKAKYRLGLSATPERADGNHHLIFLTSGEVVYKVDYEQLLSMGFLAPVRHHVIYVELSPEERRRMSREILTARSEEERRMIEKKYALKARAKIGKVLDLLRDLEGRKILIFTEYIDQAEEIYRRAKELGYRVELLIGKTTNRAEIFDRFRRGDVNIIVTTRVLDEGIDVPDADVAIIVSGSGSRRQMAQRVGRVVRGAPGKVADVYEIVTKGTIEERLSRMRRRGLPVSSRRRKGAKF